jgi:predicted RNA-binding Zn ribbon-like protein
MPASLLVDLVNGWGTVPRAAGGDRERPPITPSIERHAAAAGVTDRALEQVADELYPVFAATGAPERARLVTMLLRSSGVRPAVGSDDGRCEARWLVARKRDELLAAGAISLHAQLTEHDPERLGTCASTSCADVYIDASPGAHRRFCSVTCQNRERVAAFRRRKSVR